MPDKLCELVGKPPDDIKIALLPNAKDYYAKRAKDYKLNEIIAYHAEKGFRHSEVVDLLDFTNPEMLHSKLKTYDVVWAVGGNTFCLRQEMKRSGFDDIVVDLLNKGVVYGGDSAGAVAVGTSLRGIESVDIPDFAEKIFYDGIGLVPYVVLPHCENAYFAEANEQARQLHKNKRLLELRDNEVAIFSEGDMQIFQAQESEI